LDPTGEGGRDRKGDFSREKTALCIKKRREERLRKKIKWGKKNPMKWKKLGKTRKKNLGGERKKTAKLPLGRIGSVPDRRLLRKKQTQSTKKQGTLKKALGSVLGGKKKGGKSCVSKTDVRWSIPNGEVGGGQKAEV